MPEVETGSLEAEAARTLSEHMDELTDDQKSQLSKVLFPDTHTDWVQFAGKERELRPLSVKRSRLIHEKMVPFYHAMEEAEKRQAPYAVDKDLMEGLFDTVKILADFYGWDDAKEAIDEEDVTPDEVQELVVSQTHLQGTNDFLLSPLRLAVMIMRIREIVEVMQNDTKSQQGD